jgi:hypothetical protein
MNRTVKDAAVKKYYYQTHQYLKEPLYAFLMADNFAKRLKILGGLTPYEYICQGWEKEPERFTVNPCHHTLGLNIHAIDVDELITPEERKRFAFALANLNGIQHLHVASVPRGEVVRVHQLQLDDCLVVYECTQYKPRP